MANHKSALKRIRQNEVRRLRNRYYHKTTRTAVKVLRNEEDKNVASEQLPKVISLIDKLAKRNIIHKNKAANLKSKLTKHVNKLA
ncbi:30S ribosomal protein S20 [Riemerella anatipestifer]|uniref:Small ribosomal subunit protein bS20 n=1 Tax=Riemerella anatipestifer (strain ATCC 11845 / DSM 15868 / JCM 9532 / NCTC 11014) TaxID=693978 RepID=E4TBY3_RIEAD|nr:30S ribosomal protein S20 [Riemerella anatipestifer]ADQ82030.1 SSU ribosomal protein S20P [Riemerella anatipestifer ATCC 11845 = DSM 15868]ADZ12470.1 ribosomal protein S20 [Riemerella anatipestifer RA-GD]AFD56032.1 SSU ribosomal protein s20p [Riemerella anatipestifer ATCC 11845 = DSM 15868]AKQ40241.1 30S ribosomal protein S20 [Riemerella anatipestifer Yb2]EFT36705.1 SSU ribosomal protein S20p [Riemerella anatipestifer RA-YM]